MKKQTAKETLADLVRVARKAGMKVDLELRPTAYSELLNRYNMACCLLKCAMESLDEISDMKPKRLAQRLASSTVCFIIEMQNAKTVKVPERKKAVENL